MARKKLPVGWKDEDLSALGDIIAGQAPPSSSYNQKGDGIPFLRVNSFGERTPKTDSWTTQPLKTCERGDILVSVAGTLGSINVADGRYAITRSIFAIRINEKKINPAYVMYYLKTQKSRLTDMGSGSSQKIITRKTVSRIRIPYPEDRETQNRIVSVLERAERLRSLRAEAEVLADSFLRNVFLEMFGDPYTITKKWEVKTLSDMVSKDRYAIKRGPFGGSLKKISLKKRAT